MKLPGTNTITLNDAALMAMMERSLLCDLEAGHAKVRVTALRHTYNETIFTVTTDAESAPPTTKETP